MTIYWILLTVICLLYPICTVIYNRHHKLGDFRPVDNKNIKIYFYCVSLCMILLIGLRHMSVGIDSRNYLGYYANVRHEDFSYILDPYMDLETGYVLLEILAHKLHLGFAGFNLLYAIINVSVVSYLIYKKSPMPWLSYFLYCCFSFFILELTMMRQTLALSIVVLAVLTDKNEKATDFLKYALWIICAYFIHSSAIIALPLWFLKKIPYNNTVIFLTCTCIVIAYLSKSVLGKVVETVAAQVSEKYSNVHIESGNMGMRLYAMIGVSLLPGMIIKRFHKDKWNTFFFYCLCVMLMIFPALQAGGAIMRTYYYLYIFMIVYVPNLIESLSPQKDGSIKILILVLYLIVGIYMLRSTLIEDALHVAPYKFYWQP